MYITSISLSYLFLAFSILLLFFFIYYKFVYAISSDKNKKREKVIGKMKDPEHWRKRNNMMSLISLTWCIISIGIFVYLKFFIEATLISIFYLFGFILAVVLTIWFFLFSNKKTKPLK